MLVAETEGDRELEAGRVANDGVVARPRVEGDCAVLGGSGEIEGRGAGQFGRFVDAQ